MIYTQLKKIAAVGCLALICTLTPLTSTLSVQKAEALFGAELLATKELTFDGFAWSLVDSAVQNMLRSTTAWINSGFEGKPLYVADVSRFMMKIGDDIANEYISREGLNFLCSPFQPDIMLALDIQYRESRNHGIQQCTLADMGENIRGFLEGDFIGGGGWDTWYSVTLSPQNNPYGAFINAQSVFESKTLTALDDAAKELDRNRGFLDLVQCDNKETQEGCKTVTPGAVIEQQLNETLSLGGKRLSAADEIDEMIGALLNQFVTKALGGKSGLRGSNTYYTEYESNASSTTAIGREIAQVVDTYLGREKNYLKNEELARKILQDKERNCTVLKKQLSTSLAYQLTTVTSNIEESKKHILYIESLSKSISAATALTDMETYTSKIEGRVQTNITELGKEVDASSACIKK